MPSIIEDKLHTKGFITAKESKEAYKKSRALKIDEELNWVYNKIVKTADSGGCSICNNLLTKDQEDRLIDLGFIVTNTNFSTIIEWG